MLQQSAKILDGGRLILPVDYRRTLDIKPGDSVIIELDGDELRIRSRLAAIRRVQADARGRVPAGAEIVDDFIAEKRAEAARQDRG